MLVLLVLPLGVSSHVTQLGFDTTDQRLDLRQLGSKASLRFCQRAFQGSFLTDQWPTCDPLLSSYRWYRAPELLYGARQYDQGVDLW